MSSLLFAKMKREKKRRPRVVRLKVMGVSFGPGMIEWAVNGKRCRAFLWEIWESLKHKKGKESRRTYLVS